MKKKTLTKAVEEARRFIEKASELKIMAIGSKYDDINGYPKEQGTVNRASMDLTRALADLRQGR